MAKAKEIIVTIDKDGEVQVETKGVSGPACKQFSKALEEALGTVVSDTPTREMQEKGAVINARLNH